jgi:hypothetical protein
MLEGWLRGKNNMLNTGPYLRRYSLQAAHEPQ